VRGEKRIQVSPDRDLIITAKTGKAKQKHKKSQEKQKLVIYFRMLGKRALLRARRTREVSDGLEGVGF
jgi:hypothetical protein